MRLIWTDKLRRPMGYVSNANIDFEVGKDKDSLNDFEVEFKRYDWTREIGQSCIMYVQETEFGGIVKEIYTDTSANAITAKGYTWRGMMTKKIISPQAGQDYAYANGEINSIIKSFVEKEFPGMFYGVSKDTGVTVNNFQFERYCTLHDGMVKMLKSVGHRLDIRYIEGSASEIGYVQVQAVPIVDYSEEYELSNDNHMNFTMTDNQRGTNHLICLGKGELKDRLVIHLYTDENNNIVRTQNFKGAEEIAEVYDSSGSEESDLIKNGTEKLEKSKNHKEYTMTMEKLDLEVDVGDIVGGRDYLTGESMQKPIGRKIWTVAEGKEKLEYKLEGES